MIAYATCERIPGPRATATTQVPGDPSIEIEMPCVPEAESSAPRQRREATSSSPPDQVIRVAATPVAEENGIDVATSFG